MKTVKKAIIIALVAILAVILVALGIFQGEARTLLSVKENGDTVVINLRPYQSLTYTLLRYELQRALCVHSKIKTGS